MNCRDDEGFNSGIGTLSYTLEELTQEVASERYDIELNRNLNLLYMCLTQELEN